MTTREEFKSFLLGDKKRKCNCGCALCRQEIDVDAVTLPAEMLGDYPTPAPIEWSDEE